MIRLDPGVVDEVLAGTRSLQHRFDHTQKPEKLAAKKRAADLINARLPGGGQLMDVGGEDFYHAHLPSFEIVTHNLPERDMHTMAYRDEFDAVLAMHVLEHSPFPLLVLTLIRRALKPGGWLYVAVPKPSAKFCRRYGHQSVMPARMWRTLIEGAGLTMVKYEVGKFGPRKAWVEYRFLCRRGDA